MTSTTTFSLLSSPLPSLTKMALPPTASSATQSSTSKRINIGLIIGIVLACVFVIGILSLVCWRCRKSGGNVLRWKRVNSILGTNSTLVAPARNGLEDRYSLSIALRSAEKGAHLQMNELDVQQGCIAGGDVPHVLSPRSSLTLCPSDSASNMFSLHATHPSPTAGSQMHNELLAIRAKIRALQDEERDLTETTL